METKLFRKDFVVAREWNERRWAMVKTTRVASVATLAGLALGLCLLAAASPAQAKTTSDQPAAILYWPKIVVDTAGTITGVPTDTLVRLSNTCDPQVMGNPCYQGGTGLFGMKQAHCFYVNANSHCSNNPSQICQSGADCGIGSCDPGWSEIDFDIVLTVGQPLAWHASEGMGYGDLPLWVPGVCENPAGRICNSDSQCGLGGCVKQQSNIGTGIPPVPENPFVGSLVCIEYDPTANPPIADQTATTNTLKGEATIEGVAIGGVDIASYNAVGVKYVGPVGGTPTNQLALDDTEYATCPTALILDHLFDIPSPDGIPTLNITDLTLVPCGNDFLSQTPGSVTAQFIVYNEFEQRFSTTRLVDCFLESQLSKLDTTDPTRSIFSVFVSGTLAGQTYIRPVGNAATGRGLVGVARLQAFGASTAYNLHQQGSPTGTQPDIITIP
jgi:hypothetical protein